MLSWFFKGSRVRKLLAEPVPAAWREIVEGNVAVFRLLPEPQQQRLLAASRVIAAERHWVGCRGLAITDEIKATIASQAAILLLGVEGYYFDKLREIYVLPGDYSIPAVKGPLIAGDSVQGITDPVQLVMEDVPVTGQASWTKRIVLSWSAARAGGRNARDGENVVLHEFAHHLDSLDGDIGGRPPLPTAAAEENWERVIEAEQERLSKRVERGEATVIDPIGAEDVAEFFAYATEAFFERPAELLAEHTELYAILKDFYQVDPAAWFSGIQARPPTGSKTCTAGRRMHQGP